MFFVLSPLIHIEIGAYKLGRTKEYSLGRTLQMNSNGGVNKNY